MKFPRESRACASGSRSLAANRVKEIPSSTAEKGCSVLKRKIVLGPPYRNPGSNGDEHEHGDAVASVGEGPFFKWRWLA
jgi:hypothetical protein